MLRTPLAALVLTSMVALVWAVPVFAGLPEPGLGAEPRRGPVTPAAPPLPPPTTFPVQLVIDNGTFDGAFGFSFAPARQLMWFNRFANPPGDFTLEEIWVLFPDGADIPMSGAVQIAVFQDPDGDPSNGANLLATFNETIQVADGINFSVYPLATPIEISGSGDILIGVVNRYFNGVPPSLPAAYESVTTQDRSYFALWAGNPPDPPDLASATTVTLLTGAVTGRFLIRGFGTQAPGAATLVIPTLDGFGLALLGAALGLLGMWLLRRRSHA